MIDSALSRFFPLKSNRSLLLNLFCSVKVYWCGPADVCMHTVLVSGYRLHPQMMVAQCDTMASVEILSQHPEGRREVEENEEDAFLLGIKGYFYPLPAPLNLSWLSLRRKRLKCVCVCVCIPPWLRPLKVAESIKAYTCSARLQFKSRAASSAVQLRFK